MVQSEAFDGVAVGAGALEEGLRDGEAVVAAVGTSVAELTVGDGLVSVAVVTLHPLIEKRISTDAGPATRNLRRNPRVGLQRIAPFGRAAAAVWT